MNAGSVLVPETRTGTHFALKASHRDECAQAGEEKFKIKKDALYFLVFDHTLAGFLYHCAEKTFEPGREVGVISYNETPMKKYVKNGIIVNSTDFELMGQKAAEFVATGEFMRFEVPTTLKQRSSLKRKRRNSFFERIVSFIPW